MNNMSNDDLKKMSQMSGFNINPEMIRTASNMMNNLSDNQLNQTKQMAGTMFKNNPNSNKN